MRLKFAISHEQIQMVSLVSLNKMQMWVWRNVGLGGRRIFQILYIMQVSGEALAAGGENCLTMMDR